MADACASRAHGAATRRAAGVIGRLTGTGHRPGEGRRARRDLLGYGGNDENREAALPVPLSALTTGTATTTALDGLFCPDQLANDAGAFGLPTARAIQQNGVPAGDVSNHAPHTGVLAGVFCVPKTGNAALDGVAALPGPGALAISGLLQIY